MSEYKEYEESRDVVICPQCGSAYDPNGIANESDEDFFTCVDCDIDFCIREVEIDDKIYYRTYML